jgi:hypothetical protein
MIHTITIPYSWHTPSVSKSDVVLSLREIALAQDGPGCFVQGSMQWHSHGLRFDFNIKAETALLMAMTWPVVQIDTLTQEQHTYRVVFTEHHVTRANTRREICQHVAHVVEKIREHDLTFEHDVEAFSYDTNGRVYIRVTMSASLATVVAMCTNNLVEFA